MEEAKRIWVVCAEGNGKIAEHTFQLLGKARKLHEGEASTVTAVCVGSFDERDFQLLFIHGAQEILSDRTRGDDPDEISDALGMMAKEYFPELIMFPSTSFGRACAASLQGLINAGLTADCIDIGIHTDGRYLFSRTALNSSVIANIVCINTKIQMCTVRKNVFASFVSLFPETGKVTEFKKSAPGKRTNGIKLLLREPLNLTPNRQLENAKLVFAFGRGIGNKSTLQLFYEAAEFFGAEVAGTRAVVEEGLLDRSRQVGQSGISIAPNLYVAFGISGASQHIVGIKNANCIIAVNKDEAAPIFEYANYCIIDDCHTILDGLMKMAQRKERELLTVNL
jgi:electron transfer flavoprotein alpha subunit